MSGAEGHEVSEPWRLRLPMNLWPMDHPLTPSLSPSEGERAPEGRVREFRRSMREDLLGRILSKPSLERFRSCLRPFEIPLPWRRASAVL